MAEETFELPQMQLIEPSKPRVGKMLLDLVLITLAALFGALVLYLIQFPFSTAHGWDRVVHAFSIGIGLIAMHEAVFYTAHWRERHDPEWSWFERHWVRTALLFLLWLAVASILWRRLPVWLGEETSQFIFFPALPAYWGSFLVGVTVMMPVTLRKLSKNERLKNPLSLAFDLLLMVAGGMFIGNLATFWFHPDFRFFATTGMVIAFIFSVTTANYRHLVPNGEKVLNKKQGDLLAVAEFVILLITGALGVMFASWACLSSFTSWFFYLLVTVGGIAIWLAGLPLAELCYALLYRRQIADYAEVHAETQKLRERWISLNNKYESVSHEAHTSGLTEEKQQELKTLAEKLQEAEKAYEQKQQQALSYFM